MTMPRGDANKRIFIFPKKRSEVALCLRTRFKLLYLKGELTIHYPAAASRAE
jgi:hypothetical protein